MSNYRRAKGGSTYFFTVVTHNRQPILCLTDSIKALKATITAVRKEKPFEVKAWVLLPDHLHCVWELPEGDFDYSIRWALIKKGFTRKMKGLVATPPSSLSRIKRKEATVWQRRFWEHQIRNEDDLKKHIDYIHFNPVKHGLAGSPADWKYSTFHRYVEAGLYDDNWGGSSVDLAGTGME